MFPSTRWARQLKRDIDILGGLPEGQERVQWQRNISALARRLRAYEKYVPIWQRIAPFLMAFVWGVLIACFIAFADLREGLFAETPAFLLGLGGLVGSTGYLLIAIMGGDLRGRDPEMLLEIEESQTYDQ